ncbi:probable transcription factor At1g61730 [Mangifera indica]|uniref:probable transcription factor At1g61730 n=1 Tax=Mangifera indica TaxID=29780 RepID=UPI001CF94427|nr:probable transcription factor At1g61730 [Mangifera indica]
MAPTKRSSWEYEEDIKEIYREVTSEEDEEDEEYKPSEAFGRFWSEEQEIAILRGVIRLSVERGVDYSSSMVYFFNYMKRLLKGNFTLRQLKDKLHKMKRKFKDNLNKDKSSFSRHEKKLFRLSKRIWGAASIVCASVESFSCPIKLYSCVNGEAMDLVGEVDERLKLDGDFIALQLFQLEINMKKAQVIQGTTMYMKKAINMLQLELIVKKTQFVQKHLSMVLDVYKSYNN